MKNATHIKIVWQVTAKVVSSMTEREYVAWRKAKEDIR